MGIGCAHYQRAPESAVAYQGLGEFKTSADYATRSQSRSPSQSLSTNQNSSDAFRLFWPVHLVRINRGFRPASDPKHQGLDLGGTKSTSVLAAHQGVVIYVGHQFRGYGNMVMIEYNNQWATLYAHLSKILVKEGQMVSPGEQVGKMGRTGHATGVHLHFELMKNRQLVDPLPYLNDSQRVSSFSR